MINISKLNQWIGNSWWRNSCLRYLSTLSWNFICILSFLHYHFIGNFIFSSFNREIRLLYLENFKSILRRLLLKTGALKKSYAYKTLKKGLLTKFTALKNPMAVIITAWKVTVFGLILVCIFPYSDWIRSISPYSVRTRENADQNNSEHGHFSRSNYIKQKELAITFKAQLVIFEKFLTVEIGGSKFLSLALSTFESTAYTDFQISRKSRHDRLVLQSSI